MGQYSKKLHANIFAIPQAEFMTLSRLWRSVKCLSNVGDRLLITNVGTMLRNNQLILIPTGDKVIFRQ